MNGAVFAAQLDRFGPAGSAEEVVSLNEAKAYCRQLATSHYENFSVVSRLVPRRLHQHLCNIYAYCRWADNLADEIADRQISLRYLQWWRDELAGCFEGRTHHPVFIALRETVRQFSIPVEPFQRLIDAFEQDQRQSRYATIDELLDFCRCSANPVGHLVLYLDRSFTSESARFADRVCTGLQLANFLQDVAADYDRGRIYIPQTTCFEFGCTEAWFRERRLDESWRSLMAYEVSRAEQMLHAGKPVVGFVSPQLRWQIELFVAGGLAILQRIRKMEFDVWSRRPTVGKATKLRLVTSAWLRSVLEHVKRHG